MDKRFIPNHALDTIRNPSEACLPPSKPSLTSYVIEYGGAHLMPQGAGVAYIGRSVQREPLDQTDLRNDVDAT